VGSFRVWAAKGTVPNLGKALVPKPSGSSTADEPRFVVKVSKAIRARALADAKAAAGRSPKD
jgi:hypothetical protein